MISSFYKIEKFIEAVKDKDYIEILRLAEREVNYAERKMAPHVKGAVKARQEGGRYVAVLKGFLFFMRYGIKPYGVSDTDFELFRPVCESLVQKKQFKPSIMNFFEQK